MVPPHPSNSSSGCAAITSTRRSGIAPHLARPGLFTQGAAMNDVAVVVLQLQRDDRPAATGNHLTARTRLRAIHRPNDLAREANRVVRVAGQRGAPPDRPALSVEPPKGTWVRPRQRANEIVDLVAVARPVDQAVLGSAPGEIRPLPLGLRSTRPFAGAQSRQQL